MENKIRPEDLRLGNLLQIGSDVITVEEIFKDSIETPEHGDISITHHQLSGIPLSTEWLKKAGFKSLKNDFKIKNFFIHKRERGFVMDSRTPIIESVHQLQNLYFALTGTELLISLD